MAGLKRSMVLSSTYLQHNFFVTFITTSVYILNYVIISKVETDEV